jgi:hypothetical protein
MKRYCIDKGVILYLLVSFFSLPLLQGQGVDKYPGPKNTTIYDAGRNLFTVNESQDDVETHVDCEEFPEICDKIRDKFKPKPKPKPVPPINPDEDTDGSDGGGNKDKKKKKKKKQSMAWGDVPSWISQEIRKIDQLGLKGITRKGSNGKWIQVDSPREFIRKVFGV